MFFSAPYHIMLTFGYLPLTIAYCILSACFFVCMGGEQNGGLVWPGGASFPVPAARPRR